MPNRQRRGHPSKEWSSLLLTHAHRTWIPALAPDVCPELAGMTSLCRMLVSTPGAWEPRLVAVKVTQVLTVNTSNDAVRFTHRILRKV